MAVLTRKFSQFAPVDYNGANFRVGYSGSVNFQEPDVITWSTATRPSSPTTAVLGFNTDLQQYEYWNPISMMWVQLNSSDEFFWNDITATTATMEGNNGYVANNSAIVTLTLPITCGFGDVIGICGFGIGGWQVLSNAGQNIIFGTVATTVTVGVLAASKQYDQCELLCVVADTTFIVRNVQGNLTVV